MSGMINLGSEAAQRQLDTVAAIPAPKNPYSMFTQREYSIFDRLSYSLFIVETVSSPCVTLRGFGGQLWRLIVIAYA